MPVSILVTADVLTMSALRHKAIAGRSCTGAMPFWDYTQLVQLAIMAGRPPGLKQPALTSFAAASLLPSYDQSPSGVASIVVNQIQGFSQACGTSERSASFGSVLLRQSVTRRGTALSTALVPLTVIHSPGQGVPCSI